VSASAPSPCRKRSWYPGSSESTLTATPRTPAAINDPIRTSVSRVPFVPTTTIKFQVANGANLVNASFALPFCPPAAFPGVWWRIVRSLRPGGRFTGQLLGDADSWAREPGITHFDKAELDELLAGLEVEHLWEEEADSVTPRGEAKHWHVFHVVARRP
jgi:tellurite methyltransferase